MSAFDPKRTSRGLLRDLLLRKKVGHSACEPFEPHRRPPLRADPEMRLPKMIDRIERFPE